MDKAILVGLDLGLYDINDSLNELENLAKALNIEVVEKISQRQNTPNIKTYIGKGKVYEIKNMIDMFNIDMVIFDEELSPAQIRNLERELDTQIIDRSFLILSIFSERAKTKTAFIEVSLAQQKYLLPRLVGMRSSLSRQGGGTYNAKGPGETKLELDRRLVVRNIAKLERQLKRIETQGETARKRRDKNIIPIASLIGYTNAGKSATLNALLSFLDLETSQVFEQDMLFATLDTTARQIIRKGYPSFILTDTIGFLSRLPHAFVNSFKSTLNEVKFSNLIIHVVDGTYHEKDLLEKTTYDVLKDLDAHEINQLKVYTRLDLLNTKNGHNNGLYISNKTHLNLDVLLKLIYTNLFGKEITVQLKIPYNKHKVVYSLNNNTRILNTEHGDNASIYTVKLFESQINDYSSFIFNVIYSSDEK